VKSVQPRCALARGLRSVSRPPVEQARSRLTIIAPRTGDRDASGGDVDGLTSTSMSDDSSQLLVDGIVIVDVDLIVDRKRCRRRTTLSPPSRLDVDRCALPASTERGKAVEVDGGVGRLRTASLPSTSTPEVKVHATPTSPTFDESSRPVPSPCRGATPGGHRQLDAAVAA
jgi:hypothetical protein